MVLDGIAFLGAGIFVTEAHLPVLVALGSASPPLKAVYSRSEKSALELASKAGADLGLNNPPSVYHDGNSSVSLDALLERTDISAVIVALPIPLQPSVILKALAAGKHVISEKPVAPDVKQGIDLINTYNSTYKPKGLIWRVAENFEAEPGFKLAGEFIRSGKIGRLLFFKNVTVNYIDTDSKWYKTPWRTVPDYQGGFLLDGGVHTIAALRVVLPHPITHISAFASLKKEYLKPHDTIHAILKAGDDIHGTSELTWASPTMTRPKTDTFVFTGSEGWLSISMAVNTEKKGEEEVKVNVIRITVMSVKREKGKPSEEISEVTDVPVQGIRAELLSFFDHIRGKDDGLNLGDPFGALTDVAFIQAALNSNGQTVELAKLLDG